MRVLKFGGTSLETPERIAAAARIIGSAATSDPVAVVVSAFGGVTDGLARAAAESAGGTPASIDDLAARHRLAVRELAPPGEVAGLLGELDAVVTELTDRLQGIALVRECSGRTRDLVLSIGERLSSLVVAGALRAGGVDARAVDARDLIVTDDRHGAAQVDHAASAERVRAWWDGCHGLPVVTGFIGGNEAGETTTLGRGGSDYTASVLGAALGADAVEIWTDVDGVMRADPRVVTDATPIADMTYDELMELSHFGARVVYPPTVHPARKEGIELRIRNTFNPSFPGTRISPGAAGGPDPVRGISSISNVALLRLEGDGMIGVPGIAARLFGALATRHINIILITQASSEHSICFAVAQDAVDTARRQIEEEFALERHAGLIDQLVVEGPLAIIAAVGAAMRERPGIAGQLFGVLGEHGLNVRAIAQGSSELNISLVVDQADEPAAIRAMYDAFFRSGAGTA